ncbi:hypothetical protein [Pelagicoccus sp. SDUM812002]|uniref:hypothetical protein n=1 Tax=Pelagicoccus sp. SDUM812002 TaxID=3041266 RepID=UPI00280C85E7|nr:hypothetical protein [Pelagicoccus sp. SDUM812002]MDQ8186412.1 hypothetical protein [Pelagicoccus sp. SDUM812002]
MSASLQKLLTEQPPNTSGLHEAMALHSEAIFKEFKGILPLFLGKREGGPFINLTLPNAVTQSSENLLQTICDLIWVYNLRVISFVSAIRMQDEETGEEAMSALLITADKAHAYFQLPWKLTFDENQDISSAKRSSQATDVIPREIWSQLFTTKVTPDSRTISYDRLIERFGTAEEIPQP